MDFNQLKLKHLLVQSDKAFEQYKASPNSKACAAKYEQAKQALEQYLKEMKRDIKSAHKASH